MLRQCLVEVSTFVKGLTSEILNTVHSKPKNGNLRKPAEGTQFINLSKAKHQPATERQVRMALRWCPRHYVLHSPPAVRNQRRKRQRESRSQEKIRAPSHYGSQVRVGAEGLGTTWVDRRGENDKTPVSGRAERRAENHSGRVRAWWGRDDDANCGWV